MAASASEKTLIVLNESDIAKNVTSVYIATETMYLHPPKHIDHAKTRLVLH